MSSRVVMRGRVAWVSQDTPIRPAALYPTNRDGEYITDERVDPESPDAPWHPVGGTLYDPDMGLEFRTVRAEVLDPAQGWASAAFWCRRWNASFERYIVPLVKMGWIDAAAVRGESTRRFRCRDESRCIEWIRNNRAKTKRVKKPKAKPQPRIWAR